MAVETLSEAFWARWRISARCAYGGRQGMKSIRECSYRAELDVQTLVWTRGKGFPLSRLESRMMCPLCGSRDVRLIFHPPSGQQAVDIAREERHWAKERMKQARGE